MDMNETFYICSRKRDVTIQGRSRCLVEKETFMVTLFIGATSFMATKLGDMLH